MSHTTALRVADSVHRVSGDEGFESLSRYGGNLQEMTLEDIVSPESEEVDSGMERRPYWKVWIEPTIYYHRQGEFIIQFIPTPEEKTDWKIEVRKDGSRKVLWESIGTLGTNEHRRIDIPGAVIFKVNKALWMLNCVIGIDWRDKSSDPSEWGRKTLDDLEHTIACEEIKSHEVHEMTGYTNDSIIKVCPECNRSSIDLRKSKSPSWKCPAGHEFEYPKYRMRKC